MYVTVDLQPSRLLAIRMKWYTSCHQARTARRIKCTTANLLIGTYCSNRCTVMYVHTFRVWI